MPAHDIVIAFGAGAGDAQTQLPAHIAAAWAVVAATTTSGTPDPTQLPVASGQEFSSTHLYGMELAAGQSFTDPTSGAKVLKITDESTPSFNGTGNENCMCFYGSRGPSMSRLWSSGGKNYFTLNFQADKPGPSEGADLGMVDYCIEDQAFSNYRIYRLGSMWGGQADQSSSWMLDNAAYARYFVGDDDGVIRCWDSADDPPTEITSFNALPYDTGWGRLEEFCTGNHSFITVVNYGQSGKEDALTIDRDVVGGDPCIYAESETDNPDGVQLERKEGIFAIEYQGPTDTLWKRIVHSGCAQGNDSPQYESHGDLGYGYGMAADPSQLAPRVWWWDPSNSGGQQGTEWDWLGSDGEIVASSGHFSCTWCIGVSKDRSVLWGLFSGWGTSTGKLREAVGFIPFDYSTRSARILCHHGTDPVDDSEYYAQPHASMQPQGYAVVYETNFFQHTKWNISNKSGTLTIRETLSCSPSGASLEFFYEDGSIALFRIISGTPTGADTATGASGSFDLDSEVYEKRLDIMLAITPTS